MDIEYFDAWVKYPKDYNINPMGVVGLFLIIGKFEANSRINYDIFGREMKDNYRIIFIDFDRKYNS